MPKGLHIAFRELIGIIENPDYRKRKELTQSWIENWTTEVNHSQLVINRSQMSTQEHDFTCEHLAKRCAIDLIERDSVDISTYKNRYEVSMVALRYPKKLKGGSDEAA